MGLQIPQTAVTQNPARAYAGQLADLCPHTIASYVTEVAVAAGYGMVRGVNASGVEPDSFQSAKLPAGSGDIFQGVVVFDPMKMPLSANPTTQYAIGDMVALLRKGRIWVLTNAAVTIDMQAFCVYTTDLGKFRGDSTAATAVPGSKFLTTTSGAGLALLELNYP